MSILFDGDTFSDLKYLTLLMNLTSIDLKHLGLHTFSTGLLSGGIEDCFVEDSFLFFAESSHSSLRATDFCQLVVFNVDYRCVYLGTSIFKGSQHPMIMMYIFWILKFGAFWNSGIRTITQ